MVAKRYSVKATPLKSNLTSSRVVLNLYWAQRIKLLNDSQANPSNTLVKIKLFLSSLTSTCHNETLIV